MLRYLLIAVSIVVAVSSNATNSTPVYPSDNTLYNIVIPSTETKTNDVDSSDIPKPEPKLQPDTA